MEVNGETHASSHVLGSSNKKEEIPCLASILGECRSSNSGTQIALEHNYVMLHRASC